MGVGAHCGPFETVRRRWRPSTISWAGSRLAPKQAINIVADSGRLGTPEWPDHHPIERERRCHVALKMASFRQMLVSQLVNSREFPDLLSEVSEESIRSAMLHFANGVSHRKADHFIMSGTQLFLRDGMESRKVSLKSIVQMAGYGFSTFYKLWPDSDNVFKDIWSFSLECYMRSELEHLRQLGSRSTEDFIDTWVKHAVLSQRLVPPAMFRMLLARFFDNDLFAMMAHVPRHVENVMALSRELNAGSSVPGPQSSLGISAPVHCVHIIATHLFTGNISGRSPLTEDEAVDAIKTFMRCYLSPDSSGQPIA